MPQINLQIRITEDDINEMISRYHFNEDDYEHYKAMGEMMMPLLEVRGFYEFVSDVEEIHYDKSIVAFFTLGDGIDLLQNVYSDKYCMEEAYLIDCLGLVLLTKGYEEFIKEIQKQTKLWVSKIDFLGDEYPLELIPKLYEYCSPDNITYNNQLVLSPSKSVAIILPLSDTPGENPCNICINCNNKECIFRKEEINYG